MPVKNLKIFHTADIQIEGNRERKKYEQMF